MLNCSHELHLRDTHIIEHILKNINVNCHVALKIRATKIKTIEQNKEKKTLQIERKVHSIYAGFGGQANSVIKNNS